MEINPETLIKFADESLRTFHYWLQSTKGMNVTAFCENGDGCYERYIEKDELTQLISEFCREVLSTYYFRKM